MCQVISVDVIYKKAVVKVADLDNIHVATTAFKTCSIKTSATSFVLSEHHPSK